MRDHETDLAAVRDLLHPRTEDAAASLGRTWDTILDRSSRGPAAARAGGTGWAARLRSPLARSLALPALTFALVAAVLAGVVTAIGGGPGPGVGTPALSPGQVLEEMAAIAEAGPPVNLPKGKYIYSRTTGRMREGDGLGARFVHEMWLDPQGMIALRQRRDGRDVTGPGDVEDIVRDFRQRFADGPGLDSPTPEWLAGWPTEPGAMLIHLRQLCADARGYPAPDAHIWGSLADLLHFVEPVLTPQVRAALYRALARTGGLTAQAITVEGRQLYAVRHTADGFVQELLFDPATGRIAGGAFGEERGAPGPSASATTLPTAPASGDPVPTASMRPSGGPVPTASMLPSSEPSTPASGEPIPTASGVPSPEPTSVPSGSMSPGPPGGLIFREIWSYAIVDKVGQTG